MVFFRGNLCDPHECEVKKIGNFDLVQCMKNNIHTLYYIDDYIYMCSWKNNNLFLSGNEEEAIASIYVTQVH